MLCVIKVGDKYWSVGKELRPDIEQAELYLEMDSNMIEQRDHLINLGHEAEIKYVSISEVTK